MSYPKLISLLIHYLLTCGFNVASVLTENKSLLWWTSVFIFSIACGLNVKRKSDLNSSTYSKKAIYSCAGEMSGLEEWIGFKMVSKMLIEI